MRVFIGALFAALFVLIGILAINMDLAEDRVTKLEETTETNNKILVDNVRIDDRLVGVTEKLTSKNNELQKSIEALQTEMIILKNNLEQLQETVEKLNQTTKESFLLKELGEPQKFQIQKPDTRQATINKLKKDVRRLEETINLFQYQRQHGGLK